jgi:hypothetical protein
LTNYGVSLAYPETFGMTKGTPLANAMDKARGGYYK